MADATRPQTLGVWGIIFLSVLTHSAFGGARVNLALFGLKLSGSPMQVGLVLSTLALFPAFMSVTTGKWIDRVGARPAALLGCCCLIAGNLLPYLMPVMPALYLAAVALGLGFNFVYLAAQKLIGELSRPLENPAEALELNKKHFGYFALGFSVSGFCGPALTGVMIDYLGHAPAFGLLSIPALIGLAMTWRALHDPARPRDSGVAKTSSFALFKIPELRRLFIAILVLTSAWDVHQFLVPLYGSMRGLSATSIGLVLGSFAVATFVVRMILPFLSHRVSEWGAIAFALATSALAYLVYPMLPAITLMFMVSFALGLGLGMSQPMTLALLHQYAPAGRVGEVTGIRLSLINVSQAILPTVFGTAGAAFGIGPVFWVMSVMSASGCYMAWQRMRRDDRLSTHDDL